MRRMICMLMTLILLSGMPLANFAGVTGTNKTPLKLKQSILVNNVKTKEGIWKSIELTMMEIKQQHSTDTKMNAFRVKMYVTLDTFKGSPKAILSNNFPMIFIGDSQSKVNFDNVEDPLFGYKGICKLNAPYKGENYEIGPKDSGSVVRIGSFNILVPKDKDTVIFPITFSNNQKVYFELFQKYYTNMTKFLLKNQKTYGSKDDGQFVTQLDLIEDPVYSGSESADKSVSATSYILRNGTELEEVNVSVKTCGDSKKINSETLESVLKESVTAGTANMTKIGNNAYKLEGKQIDDTYWSVVYYGFDNYYRKLSVSGSVKFKQNIEEIVNSYVFVNDNVVIEPRFMKAKQVNGLYVGNGNMTPFKTSTTLYNNSEPLFEMVGVEDNRNKFYSANSQLWIAQETLKRSITLDKWSEFYNDIYSGSGRDFNYFEIVKKEFGIFVSNFENEKKEIRILRVSKGNVEEIVIEVNLIEHSGSVKEIILSLLEQYGYNLKVADQLFEDLFPVN